MNGGYTTTIAPIPSLQNVDIFDINKLLLVFSFFTLYYNYAHVQNKSLILYSLGAFSLEKNVLIACEESQTALSYFFQAGFNAFSCDLKKPSGNFPFRHVMSDVRPLLEGNCAFSTLDGVSHFVSKWDLVIAHPPCTFLTKASSPCLAADHSRYYKGLLAKRFFLECLNANSKRVCVENPVPLKLFNLPPASQVVEPYFFGDPFTKKTYLWMKNLPLLWSTDIVIPEKSFVLTSGNSLGRSKSFDGIARAMFEQWSFLL